MRILIVSPTTQAVDKAAADGEQEIGDAEMEAETEIGTEKNTDIEREMTAQSNQETNVSEKDQQEAEDLRRKSEREKWVIGIAEQRAQAHVSVFMSGVTCPC